MEDRGAAVVMEDDGAADLMGVGSGAAGGDDGSVREGVLLGVRLGWREGTGLGAVVMRRAVVLTGAAVLAMEMKGVAALRGGYGDEVDGQ
ncbi:hypothetical protein F0562_006034 [Nyssa sinensis]|uniref:Uncharacterized protein n=1 Tax=Nyssa sinensis TaxID=561372 RepID=A0A5J5AJT2_9ASTE|nr:hypothetical protein F0562_006034 [Nyssa sinensis]